MISLFLMACFCITAGFLLAHVQRVIAQNDQLIGLLNEVLICNKDIVVKIAGVDSLMRQPVPVQLQEAPKPIGAYAIDDSGFMEHLQRPAGNKSSF